MPGSIPRMIVESCRKGYLDLNKTTKIRLNYTLGAAISLLLLWGIYIQLNKQLDKLDISQLVFTQSYWLYLTLLLMFANILLEAKKWQLLVRSAQTIFFKEALLSYLSGLAISIITPNRVGEYPGRILYMNRKNTIRLIGVSILGSIAQILTLCIYGTAGLIYYTITYAGKFAAGLLFVSILLTIIMAIAYWRFETWIPLLDKIKWLKKYQRYGALLKKFTFKQQGTILLISLIRYAVYTTQYLLMLYWMNVDIAPIDGFLMSALFFWIIAILPSVALLEIGARGSVGLFLFSHLSGNTMGILAATVAIWCINLMLPAIVGSIISVRMKLLKV